MSSEAVVVDVIRTPVGRGKPGGALSGVHPVDLAAGMLQSILERNGLLKHHTVGTPFSKENLLRGVAGWPHWTAVLKENTTAQKWAVDSWIYANGENPAIVEAEKWYISSLDQLPKSTH